MDRSTEEKMDILAGKTKRAVRKANKNIKKAADTGERGAIDIINSLVDKAQRFTAERLERAEDRLGRM